MTPVTITSAMAGLLTSWHGLPADTTLELISAAVQPVRHVREVGITAQNRAGFQVTLFEREEPPRNVQAWVPRGEQHVSLLEYDDPPIKDLEKTLAVFGPPEWILENRRFDRNGLVTEYVYATRGITFSILVPDASSSLRTRMVTHLQLYHPGTVESYLTGVAAVAIVPDTDSIPVLRDALAGNLSRWHGLNGSEMIEMVLEAAGPRSRSLAPEPIERHSMLFRRVIVERPTPPQRVEAWSRFGEEFITVIEYDALYVDKLEEILHVFGKPALVTESKNRFVEGAVVQEMVFSDRGVTLSVAVPYATLSKPRSIVHVQLYRAGSAEYYRRYVGAGPELRPSPRRALQTEEGDS